MTDEQEAAFRYRHRAEEVRMIAAESTDPKMRDILVRVAEDYEKMAQTLERIAQPAKPTGRKQG